MEKEKLKDMLNNSNKTCVAIKGNHIYQSELKGIMPIMTKLKENSTFFEGADVADVVIGKAAALLLVYGRAQSIYTRLISEHAIEVLDKYQITYEYDKRVPFIMNRNKDGMCPMEQTVLETMDPEQAFKLLLQKTS
jgi:L-lactate utilization protein LutC